MSPPSIGDFVILNRILLIIACVCLPVLWGVLVNAVFQFWKNRSDSRDEDDPVFPDYQI